MRRVFAAEVGGRAMTGALHPYIVGNFWDGFILVFDYSAREALNRFAATTLDVRDRDELFPARAMRVPDYYLRFMVPGATEPHEAASDANPRCTRCRQWLCSGDCDEDIP